MAFFDEQTEQSKVKSEIVVDYFVAWARILSKGVPKIVYADLYCGPGQYKSGQRSTPLFILEKAIADPALRLKLSTIFNDADPARTEALEGAIRSLPGIESLRYQPEVTTCEVDERYAQRFEQLRETPILAFVDPWGYKGVSKQLLRSLIRDFGCECIFLFNYNRINMAINNEAKEQHLVALLGAERVRNLRREVVGLAPAKREGHVMRAVGEAVDEIGGKYLVPFRFTWRHGRTSHYICFVSKHHLGYTIMKQIMASRGIVDEDGVPEFEYLPRHGGKQLPFGGPRPILALPEQLHRAFAGQTMTVRAVFDAHNLGTPFILRNYKKVLMDMEERGEISCEPDRDSRRKNTIADHVLVSFSPKLPP